MSHNLKLDQQTEVIKYNPRLSVTYLLNKKCEGIIPVKNIPVMQFVTSLITFKAIDFL